MGTYLEIHKGDITPWLQEDYLREMKEVSMELLEEIPRVVTAPDLGKTVRVIQCVFYQTLTDYSISEVSNQAIKVIIHQQQHIY